MAYTMDIEQPILKTKYILGSLGFLGKIRIAFDEWNLRDWHHPHVNSGTDDYLTSRDKNDINSSYTMADAVFTACFLNQCLKHPFSLTVQSSIQVLFSSVIGDSKDAYNDIGKEQVRTVEQPLKLNMHSNLAVEILPRSVNVLVIK